MTVTTDNGTEFCNRKAIAMGLNTTVYFTGPYSSWQKGSIENVNGLIRQYIPKSTPIKHLKDNNINVIATKSILDQEKNSISQHQLRSF